MSTLAVFHWLQNTSLAAWLRDSNPIVVQATQVVHVLGLILLLTALLLVNLRLLGWGLRTLSISQITKATSKMLSIGLVLALLSGTVLFLSAAANYYSNPAFWPKIALLVLAVLVQFTLFRKVTATDSPNPALAKTTALISLTLWFGVGFAGRAIGYV